MLPSKVISDQYAAVTFVIIEGRVITGRIANLSGDVFMVQTDMLKPSAFTRVDRLDNTNRCTTVRERFLLFQWAVSRRAKASNNS